MSTVTLVSEQEYLKTVYEPDCEFEDGLLIERNAGEEPHSWLQAALAAYFFRRRKLWNIEAYPALRIHTRQGRYMIPDLCVIPAPRSRERILTQPPLIWIEILSPEDRPIRVNKKIREILDFGVPNVWVIDPDTLESEVHSQSGSRIVTDGILRVDGTPVEVPLHGLEES